MDMPMVNVRQMAVTVNRVFVGVLMAMFTTNRRMILMKMMRIIMVMAVIMALFMVGMGVFMILG